MNEKLAKVAIRSLFRCSISLQKNGFLFCFFFISLPCLSQSDSALLKNGKEVIDSLAENCTKEELSELFNTDIKTYIRVFKRKSEFAADQKDTAQIMYTLDRQGCGYIALGDYSKAESSFFEGLHYASSSQNAELETSILKNLGNLYYMQAEFVKAKNYLDKSVKSAESIRDRKSKMNLTLQAKMAIGLLYIHLGMSTEARTIYNEVLKELQTWEDKKKEMLCYTYIGGSYLMEKKANRALEYLQEALIIAPPNTSKMNIAEIQGAMSDAYFQLKKYPEARAARNAAISYYRIVGYKDVLDGNLINLAKIYLFENQHLDSAIMIAEPVLQRALEIEHDSHISFASDVLYRAYKKKGEIAKALEMKELSEVYAKELDIAGKSEQLKLDKMRAQLRYEEEKNLSSIKHYDKSQKEARTNLKLIILSAGLIILVISFLYFRKYRKHNHERKRLLAQLAQLNSRTELASGSDDTENVQVELDEHRINESCSNKLNETDWKVIYELKSEPSSTNKEIASRIHMSYDGVVSSLRKMYQLFSIEVKKNHKLELLVKLYKISETQMTE